MMQIKVHWEQGYKRVWLACLLDDFQREPVPLVADFLHPPGYLTANGTASPNRRDKADGGGPVAACILTCECPIGAAYGDPAPGALGRIVGEADTPLVEEATGPQTG
jgi:hypothetical protein